MDEENIDIVGDGHEEEEAGDGDDDHPRPMETEDPAPALPNFPNLPSLPHLPQSPQLASTVPLTVQITPDSAEPSGAKKRKPLKTTKLQVE